MRHLNEAREEAERALGDFLKTKTSKWRALLVEDAFSRLRVILWGTAKEWQAAADDLQDRLGQSSAPFWSGDVIEGSRKGQVPDGPWQAQAWEDASSVDGQAGLRVLERHRAKTGWYEAPTEPPWPLRRNEPAIVLFYSFKGGVGRSTALAASALRLAVAGQRVVVLDADLDAPGVGSVLAGHDGIAANWGVVDYLVERPIVAEGQLDLADYYHRCPPSLVPGAGELFVFPAGKLDDRYLQKLARLDYGLPERPQVHPFQRLLQQVREELSPQWILVDARAGLGDVSGFLAGGLCHLYLLLGTLADASWRGLELVLERLGGERVRRGEAQSECVLAAGMVPRSQEKLFEEAVSRFTDKARDVFSHHYYAETPSEFWSLDDVESGDAPHVPVALPYDERLALFRDLSEVAAPVLLKAEPFAQLAERLTAGVARLKESNR